ncbi:hypothetical protein N035_017835 [Klebsiella pneumoniae EGD-HP19-C]|nr:hypothetical protein N035_017835 [Klebsiella pneumoniae EGD-HP19-C]
MYLFMFFNIPKILFAKFITSFFINDYSNK